METATYTVPAIETLSGSVGRGGSFDRDTVAVKGRPPSPAEFSWCVWPGWRTATVFKA